MLCVYVRGGGVQGQIQEMMGERPKLKFVHAKISPLAMLTLVFQGVCQIGRGKLGEA